MKIWKAIVLIAVSIIYCYIAINYYKNKKGRQPFYYYPSQATHSSIAFAAISPRNTDSVRI